MQESVMRKINGGAWLGINNSKVECISIHYLTRWQMFNSKSNIFWKVYSEKTDAGKNLVQNLTRCETFVSKSCCSKKIRRSRISQIQGKNWVKVGFRMQNFHQNLTRQVFISRYGTLLSSWIKDWCAVKKVFQIMTCCILFVSKSDAM